MYKLTIILTILTLLLQGCLLGSFTKSQLLFYSSVTPEEFRTWALSLKDQSSVYQTLKNFHKYGYDNMKWEEDSWNGYLDYPRDPLIVLKRKRGDCDDFTSLFANGLIEVGIPASMLSVAYMKNGKATGHTVCLVKVGNLYYHIGNWEVKYTNGQYNGVYGPYATLKDAIRSIDNGNSNYYFIRDAKTQKKIESGNL